MEYVTRLYLILHPHNALVASQYDYQQFAKHYTQGSAKHYNGKVVFAEIDPSFRHDYFRIDDALREVVPHTDGRPKATKFISTYRVLEHIAIDAIRNLYLATQEGYAIELEAGVWQDPYEEGFVRIYTEIAPMRMLVLSNYDFVEFGRYITDPGGFKSAPAQLYAQVDLNIVEFLEEFEHNPFRLPPITSIHPSVLRDSFHEIKMKDNKHTKGLCLDASLDQLSYRLIRHGFMFARGEAHKFFPMPSLTEIETKHYKFWRSM